MRNFRFRLQSVLEQRERQEEAAKVSFAQSETALRRGEGLLAELREVRAVILSELASQSGAPDFDPMLTRLYQDYLQTVGKGIRDQERYVRDLLTTCEAYKLHLITATQGRQALMTVRDRAHHSHMARVRRLEQNALDEIATARYTYQQGQQD